jgi:glucokinase
MAKHFLGIDIGGTNIKYLVLDSSQQILVMDSVPSTAQVDASSVRQTIRGIYAKLGSYRIEAIGIGCAGSVDFRAGVVRNSPNFPTWKQVPLCAWVREDTEKPVSLDNDANAAALAELRMGQAYGHENCLLITLGTGVGGGVIIRGEVYRGSTGTGGELGHFSIQTNGPACNCGSRGCFERYCSATAIQELYGISAPELFDIQNQKKYSTHLESFISQFSLGLTSLANVFDPELILLGGAMSEGVLRYQGRILEEVRKQVFPAVAENLEILGTQFHHQSGALGAALLAKDQAPMDSSL